jgi:hypothetical protein
MMVPSISSPLLVRNLTAPGPAFLGKVIYREGRRLEIAVDKLLPIGTAVAVETDSILLLGDIIGVEPSVGSDGQDQSLCVVYLDQCLNLAQCTWPAWSNPVRAETARKLSEVSV